MTSRTPRFSVVINTFNRLPFLRKALRSLRAQRYPDFEVVVVDGPSTDGTRELLQTLAGDLVLVTIPERNLSRSRNAGIDAATGDVVCFIDDDAVADPGWLEALATSYASDLADAIGGFVYDHTGYRFQSRYLYCDRLGRVVYGAEDHHSHFNFPQSARFPYLMGTNATFRRAILEEVGGFDEVFAWFYDESELCLRLNDLGFRIAVNPHAVVYHKYAPSHLRTADSVPKTFFLPARSTSYFVYRHGLPAAGFAAVCDRIDEYRRDLEHWARWHHVEGRIDAVQRDQLIDDARRGIDAGHEEALRWRDGHAPGIAPPRARPWRPFDRCTPDDGRALHVCLLTSEYPIRPCGGIGRYVRELAIGLVELGHHVHVMLPGDAFTVDYVDGVWVHTIDWRAPMPDDVPVIDVPEHYLRNSALLDAELRRVHAADPVDVVLAPIWDAPGIVTLLRSDVPFVLTLHSTYKIIAEQNAQALDASFVDDAVPKLVAAEALALARSPHVVGNSHYFSQHVAELYDVDLGGRIVTIHHGIEDRAGSRAPRPADDRRRVLYVGRFEYRKGADLLLAAIPSVIAAMEGGIQFDLVGADRPRDRSGETFRRRFEREHGDLVRRELVRFHGHVPDDALDAFYRDADLFVAPSRFESFGLIYIEAMMHGLPTVALASGAATEIFDHGVTGHLVAEPSATALASALREMLRQDDEALRTMGSAARVAFEARFTRAQMARSFVARLRAWSPATVDGTQSVLKEIG
jgi:hypothetical protein